MKAILIAFFISMKILACPLCDGSMDPEYSGYRRQKKADFSNEFQQIENQKASKEKVPICERELDPSFLKDVIAEPQTLDDATKITNLYSEFFQKRCSIKSLINEKTMGIGTGVGIELTESFLKTEF